MIVDSANVHNVEFPQTPIIYSVCTERKSTILFYQISSYSSDNISSFSAWANDEGYSQVFVGQLSTFASEGDLVIAYSGSGNSDNIINGIKYAKSIGCDTVGITGDYKGMGGGKLAKIADLAIIVPSTSMERIEDIQLIINHIIKEAVKSEKVL